ncbi:hypothetical protein GCK72_003746 [Caenorhabditis remanei]|uniref:F-box domain-containing protein n=1 Tax=Caenorhabditis remanei TaxID=31234 RepID=A0A6A5HAB8_CAERE|nr:hypothetical protein GCK72_003746 [Caenorhabditis remanei]KAF1763801.1 hypothetical protein GCK72_003746 [Caenorhabditis remanei]
MATSFPIQKLPYLVLNKVVGLMANIERLALLLTSKKTESLVLSLKFPNDKVHTIYFAEGSCGFMASILVSDHGENATPIKFDCSLRNGAGRNEEMNAIQKWCDVEGDFIKRAQTIYTKIQKLFPVSGLSLRLNYLSTESVERILAAPEFNHWWEVYTSGNIQPDAIKLIMDHASPQRRIICDSEVKLPIDFCHPNAFAFKVAKYFVATWASLDQLLAIRYVDVIGLGQTGLRCDDVNVLLHKFLETGYQMCNELEISVTGGIDVDALTEDLLTFKVVNGVYTTFFLCTPTATNSKIAKVFISPNRIIINIGANEDDFLEARRLLTLIRTRNRIQEEMNAGEMRQMEIEQVEREINEAEQVLMAAMAE